MTTNVGVDVSVLNVWADSGKMLLQGQLDRIPAPVPEPAKHDSCLVLVFVGLAGVRRKKVKEVKKINIKYILKGGNNEKYFCISCDFCVVCF